jgi:hypothetical protein
MRLPLRLGVVVGLLLILVPAWLSGASASQTPAADGPAYANAAFQAARDRLDKPIDGGQVSRTWFWGPAPLTEGLQEPYAEAPGGMRSVQYFDKGRMEQLAANGPVSNGLLTRELISGWVQLGDATYEHHDPSSVPIAGDTDNAWPTYASFADLIDHPTADLTGQHATNVIVPGGTTVYAAAANDPATEFTQRLSYVGALGATGYNVPRVFWDFLNAPGIVWDSASESYAQAQPLMDWLSVVGYPLSDPFWANIKVAGTQTWVLIQPFERRVLTYTPSNALGWQVEMGNVGQHYYAWRYGAEPGEPTPTPTPSPSPSPTPVTPGSDFFAMQVGDTWTYQVVGTDDVYQVAITGVSSDFIPGKQLLVRAETRPDGSVERSYWETHETVLWLSGYEVFDPDGTRVEHVVYTPEVRYLGMTLDLGVGWATDTYPTGADNPLLTRYQLTVDAVGVVDVPVGQYTASHLTATTALVNGDLTVGPVTVLRGFDFVPYVGVIRDERPDGTVLELVGAELH